MKLLRMLMRVSRSMVLFTMILGLVSGASNAALLSMIDRALKQTAAQRQEMGLMFAILVLISLSARIGSQALLSKLQQDIVLDLRMRLARQFLSTSLRHLEQAGPHRVLSSLSNDTSTIGIGLMVLPQVFIDLTIVIGSIVYLSWVSWQTLLFALGFIAVGMSAFLLPSSAAMRLRFSLRQQENSLFKGFLALMDGAKELRLNRLRRQSFMESELEPLAQQIHTTALRSETLFALASSSGTFLYMVLLGLLLFVMTQLQLIPESALTSSVLIIFYIQQPLGQVLFATPHLGRAVVSLENLERLGLSFAPEIPAHPALEAGTEGPRHFQTLELLGVTHTYRRENEDGSFTLGPIDLRFHPGELVFLVGGNGSGKTTLAKMLTGLYPPESGEIRVDGLPVRDEQLDDYRQYFSAVFFDFQLFERLLGVGSPEQLERARHYLPRLQLDRKVQIQGDTFSTTELSQGQRKRLALLTACLEDRPFYIFDEWAADQDPFFKEVFYKEFLGELKSQGKTVLAITHDDRYFHLADRVIHLESGQLVSAVPSPELKVVGQSAPTR